MLILKLTHWMADDEEDLADPDEPKQDDTLYVNAARIVTFDSDLHFRYSSISDLASGRRGRQRSEGPVPVTKLVLEEGQVELVTERPEQIIELLREGANAQALGTASILRVAGVRPPEPVAAAERENDK